MPIEKSDRSSHFPAIEKKYGLPIKYWFDQMQKISDKKYLDQIAFLKENHGFSQTHANALVMYSKGSTSSKRFKNLSEYLAPCTKGQAKTVRKIFRVIKDKYPNLEIVIAWNAPQLKYKDNYIFGVSVLKNHILLAPWKEGVLKKFTPKLQEYKVNKKTFQVPSDWNVDEKLLLSIIKESLISVKK
jgi:uncharacterized protein YdhG (YjbR/CyaY superfamily)